MRLLLIAATVAATFGATAALAQSARSGPEIDLTLSGLTPMQVDSVEAARRTGRAFVGTATGAGGTVGVNPTIPAASSLNVALANKAGSGKRVIIVKRRFDNNALYNVTPLAYGGINQAVVASPAVSYGGGAQAVGGSFATTSSAATFTAAVQTSQLNNSGATATPSATGFLPVGGHDQSLVEWRILLPGQSFGNFITGQAAGLGSVSGNITYFWIEEPCGACLQ